MPMTLNGSGSITGLVAGGLPDGTITGSDLASGAAASNLAGSTVPGNVTLTGDLFLGNDQAIKASNYVRLLSSTSSSGVGLKTGSVYASNTDYANSNPNGGEIIADASLRTRVHPSRLHFYSYATQDSYSTRYVHLKTGINVSAGNAQMYSIKFTGYSYGEAKPIDANLVFYNYFDGSTAYLTSIGWAGTHVCSAYKSSDNKVVLTLYFGSGFYFTGFTVSQFYTTQGLADFSITNSANSASATGVF